MPNVLNSINQISYTGNNAQFNSLNVNGNATIKTATISISNETTANITNANITNANITNLTSQQLTCINNTLNQLFDISGCVVYGLTDNFKDMICDAVNNYCPYYTCGDNGCRGINSSDNDISFFHEELITNNLSDTNTFDSDDNSVNELTSTFDSSTIFTSIDSTFTHNDNLATQKNVNFITKNLSSNESLHDNILKIITIEKIKRGKWIFNGNICISIPKYTDMTNLKLFVYLDENLVQSGEIDLGSHEKTNCDTIKSFSYNMMFNNDLSGREIKIALMPFDNEYEIKLLKTTNFFLNHI